jgi:hypothetical protein
MEKADASLLEDVRKIARSTNQKLSAKAKL